ncbi:mechanosensitive ion channel family protein [Pistricoccus aurantiacus]|uniref:mechanosensitive ion channel family protein n=1 Tax=Pistricoccus aurantiacus TaxID=1883414 RepID=UPI00363BC006
MLLVLITLIATQAGAAVGPPNPLAPLDTSSPRATYSAFLENSRRVEALFLDYRDEKSKAGAKAISDALYRSSRVFDLSQIPPAQRGEVAGESNTYLFDILLRLPRIDVETIPDGTEMLPSQWTIPNTELTIARVSEGDRAGEYLFSPETVARLPVFHQRIISYPPLRPTSYNNWIDQLRAWTGPLFPYAVVEGLPEALKKPFLDTPRWKVLLTLAIWVAIVAITIGWAFLLRRMVQSTYSVSALFLRITVPLLLAGLVRAAHQFALYQSNLVGAFAHGEVIATTVALYGAVAWLLLLSCFLLVELIIALPAIPDQSYDAHLLRLLARIGGILVAGSVLLYGANEIGIPALGLLAGVGVGGIALALAAQSTIENLLGSFSIFADRPFRIGDFIQYGTSDGVVEAIGPRSARVRGLDGTLTTVPNRDLAQMHIVNYSLRDKCLFVQTIRLRYETSRQQLEWILSTIRERFLEHALVEETPGMPRVRLIDFGTSSIDVEVRAHVLTADFSRFLEVKEELLLQLRDIVKESGSNFALNSQTLYLGRDSGLQNGLNTKTDSQDV